MLFTFLLTGMLALNPFKDSPPRVPLAPAAPVGVEPCRIYGSIYFETDPRRRGQCFATVYIEPEPAFADMLVYQESNKLFADKAGFWHLSGARDFADYALFLTDNRNLADFSISYTKVRSYAGCRDQR